MFRRVLIPLDGSPASESIVPRLPLLSMESDAEVVLLHVMSLPPASDGYAAGMIPTIRKDSEEFLLKVRQRLSKGKRFRLKTELVEGTPSELIPELAKKWDVDLIAMTTHGRKGPRRWVFGSIAEHVMDHVSVPVLVFKPEPGEESEVSEGGDLLLVVDDSTESTRGAELACRLSKKSERTVRLLHVWKPQGDPYTQEDARRTIQRSEAILKKAGVRVTTHLPAGDPANKILSEAARGVGLVILDRHNRAGWLERIFGGVQDEVTRHASVPVLLLPPGWTLPE